MAIFQDSPSGQLLRNVFFVLIIGGVFALIFGSMVIFFFKPTTGPGAGTLLPAARSAEFDYVEFLYPEKLGGAWKQREVSADQYEKVLSYLVQATSVMEAPEHVRSFFDWEEPAKIRIMRKTPDGESVFLYEVQFLTTDEYFRIRMKGVGQEPQWAYFYYPDIYNIISQIIK